MQCSLYVTEYLLPKWHGGARFGLNWKLSEDMILYSLRSLVFTCLFSFPPEWYVNRRSLRETNSHLREIKIISTTAEPCHKYGQHKMDEQ